MKIRHKFNKNILFHAIRIIYIVFFLIINYLNLFCTDSMNYVGKKIFSISNFGFLLSGFILIIAVGFLYFKMQDKINSFMDQYGNRFIYLASAGFIILQMILIYNYYFFTGWDVATIREYAIDVAYFASRLETHVSNYYSLYPNNLFLTACYGYIVRFGLILGISGMEVEVMGILIVQCLLFFVSAIALYQTLIIITGTKGYALLGWGTYLLFIGNSPWFSITYSDAAGICFPILILHKYIWYKKDNRGSDLFWCGFFSYIGYSVKPQIMIVSIAIIIVELLHLEKAGKRTRFSGRDKLLVLFCAFLSSMLLVNAVVNLAGIQVDKERKFGVTHWVMMGLNPEDQGAYSQHDVDFSASFDDRDSRSEANLEIIRERIETFGVIGLMKHLKGKLLSSYSDGTFAWGGEGTFYYEVLPEKKGGLSPFLRSIYYQDGEHYGRFHDYMQLIWITLLAGTLAAGFVDLRCRDKGSDIRMIMFLSLIGLTLFMLLFEVRARYLFIYAPFYVMAAVSGWKYILERLFMALRDMQKITRN